MNSAVTRARHFLSSTTSRLSLTYLAIIMLMSIGFSVVFYNTSSHELGRQIPPPNRQYINDFSRRYQYDFGSSTDGLGQSSLDQFLQNRIKEGRKDLLIRLVIVNVSALVAGSVVSYALARRTLRPIEAAMEAQVQFVSDASHELKTPLAAIQVSNEVMLRKPNLTLNEAKELIRENTEDVIRLRDLSDGLLRLARQEEHHLALQATSLKQVANEAADQVQALAAAKKIKIVNTTADVGVLTDLASMTQLTVILLDNAIKYSPKKSTVYLESRHQGKFAYLTVRDEGIGIPAEDLPRLFQRFYRVDSARTQGDKPGGYGLGLSIAEKITRQLQADLTVRSKLGEGSSFTIRVSLE